MQKLQITVSEEELRFLEGVRDTGFSSVQEVIRCAALSYLDSRADDARPPDAGTAAASLPADHREHRRPSRVSQVGMVRG